VGFGPTASRPGLALADPSLGRWARQAAAETRHTGAHFGNKNNSCSGSGVRLMKGQVTEAMAWPYTQEDRPVLQRGLTTQAIPYEEG